jgi:uncharacterized membrane protein required for colicin V production
VLGLCFHFALLLFVAIIINVCLGKFLCFQMHVFLSTSTMLPPFFFVVKLILVSSI